MSARRWAILASTNLPLAGGLLCGWAASGHPVRDLAWGLGGLLVGTGLYVAGCEFGVEWKRAGKPARSRR